MKRTRWLILLFLPMTLIPISTSAKPFSTHIDIPYLYYYSRALNGIVIERADGTDSRIIGQGLVDENVLFSYGPGWSPDGRWFAWRVLAREGYYNFGKGYVISADGQTELTMLDRFPCVDSMIWHPTENILLVWGSMTKSGNTCPNGPYPVSTYWLIDVDSQNLLATFSINSADEDRYPIYWFPEKHQIQFFASVPINADYDIRYFLVTMLFDGTVAMEPTSEAEASSGLEGMASILLDDSLTLFSNWAEATRGRQIVPPSNSGAVGGPVSGQWDSSGKWLFIGYEFCISDCAYVTGQISVFNPESGQNRELTDCGALLACVGWLPEKVHVADLPPGHPISVLPAPLSMDYSHTAFAEFGYGGFKHIATHELVCNVDSFQPTLSLVRNISTGEVDFILPKWNSCGEPVQSDPEPIFPTKPIIFALSPDKRYYAVTDSTENTALYDAETGEPIATLNFYGIRLSFSEDSRYLITLGRLATATWDIERLVAESAE